MRRLARDEMGADNLKLTRRTILRSLAIASIAVIVLMQVASIPLYTGGSLGLPFASQAWRLGWRLEHGRLTLWQSAQSPARESFYVAGNSEGLRWMPEARMHGLRDWSFTIPLWMMVLGASFAAWRLWKPASMRRKRAMQGACLKCGYTLSETQTICPECGSQAKRKG